MSENNVIFFHKTETIKKCFMDNKIFASKEFFRIWKDLNAIHVIRGLLNDLEDDASEIIGENK